MTISYTTISYLIFIFLNFSGYLNFLGIASPLLAQGVMIFYVLVASFLMFFKENYVSSSFKNIRRMILIYLILTLVVHIVLNLRLATYLQIFVGWGVVYFMARKTTLTNLYKYLWLYFLFMVGVSIFSFIIGSTTSHILPFSPSERIQVNLGYSDSKHFTAAIGLLLFMLSIDKMFRLGEKKNYIILGLLLGVYFVVLSNSRGFLLELLIFILSYFLFYRFNTFLSVVVPILLSISLVLLPVWTEVLQHFLPSYVSDFIGLNRAVGADLGGGVTAGRYWLWVLHLDIFEKNWLFGIGKFFADDVSDGASVFARSESFFTYTLARDGFIGVFNFFISVFLVFIARKGRNKFGYSIGICLFISSGTLGYTNNLYSSMVFLYYLIYFSSYSSSFNAANNKKCINMSKYRSIDSRNAYN